MHCLYLESIWSELDINQVFNINMIFCIDSVLSINIRIFIQKLLLTCLLKSMINMFQGNGCSEI